MGNWKPKDQGDNHNGITQFGTWKRKKREKIGINVLARNKREKRKL